jgi:uncharacterized membrane protein
MEAAIHQLAHWGNLALETIAILVVLFGSAQAVVAVVRVVAGGADKGGLRGRHVWLVYARWLVAGLTFQLAADIVGTSLATDWQDVARLAVIAVVRTLLSYFLDKEVENTRRLQHPEAAAGEA